MFPNPTNQLVSIKITNSNELAAYRYQINTIEGKLLVLGTSEQQQINIDVSQLAKGSYLFVLLNGEKQVGQTALLKQ
ncbi:MAG: hypothetical protein ACI9DK_001102 [Vicingaceae bacterium]